MANDVLLLSCYELGHQPLGLAWPQAFLRRAGIPATVADLALDPLPEADVRAAKVVAISVPMHTALRLGVAAAERVRALNPNAHVVFHGLYADLNAEYLLERLADTLLAGESEEALVAVARETLDGSRNGRPRRARALERLDFPAPDRSGLSPIDRYARFMKNGQALLAGHVDASRGCKHLCRHCPIVPIYGGRFFAVPVETVMADVRQQVATGARHITFGDPDFLNGPTHAIRVARALHAEFPAVTFDFTAKVEHLLRHEELLPPLRELGCEFVVSAVESLSDRVLDRLRKGHTAEDVARVVELLDRAGIALQPTLVAFTPWTSLDDYVAMLEFFRGGGLASHVPPIQLAIRLLVPPGSALLGDPETAAAFGPLDRENFVYTWTHPDARMDRLYEQVSAAVARADELRLPDRLTWDRVRTLAYAAAGREASSAPAPVARPEPPRLSEAWFCCAEPSPSQARLVDA